jgi:aquaporin TIP
MGGFSRNDQRAIVAEFLATMYFVFLGCGSVVAALQFGGGNDAGVLVVIAVAHGFAILTAVAWTANISGGHINPAVTIGVMISRNMKPALGVAYIVAQFAGAILGALLLKLVIPDAAEAGLGAHALGAGTTKLEGFGLEMIMTTFLVWVIFNTAVSKKGWSNNAPIAIGLAVMLCVFVGVPFTGGSVNPARSLGPALVGNEWDNFWIYLLAPSVGGALVGITWLWWKTFGDDDLEPVVEAYEPGIG